MVKPATFEDIGFFAGLIICLCGPELYIVISGAILMALFQYMRWRRDKLIRMMIQYLMEQEGKGESKKPD